MEFRRLALPEVILVVPDVHRDARGFFLETYHAKKYRAGGIDAVFVQDNQSRSRRGTLEELDLVEKSMKLMEESSLQLWSASGVAFSVEKLDPEAPRRVANLARIWAGIQFARQLKKSGLHAIFSPHHRGALQFRVDAEGVIHLVELGRVDAGALGPVLHGLIGEELLAVLVDRVVDLQVVLVHQAHGLQRVVQLGRRPPLFAKHHRHHAVLDVLGLALDPAFEARLEVGAVRACVGEEFDHLDLAVRACRLRRNDRPARGEAITT